MIETHSEVMNAVIAQVNHETQNHYTVYIVYQNPNTGQFAHMSVGNGGTPLYIFYAQAHFTPMWRNG